MCVPSPQASPAADADCGEEEDRLRAGLAARVASGPGLWLQELEGLDRGGLLEQLLGEGVAGEAAGTAPYGHKLGLERGGLGEQLLGEGVACSGTATPQHGHKLDRVLTAKNPLLSVTAGCLFA